MQLREGETANDNFHLFLTRKNYGRVLGPGIRGKNETKKMLHFENKDKMSRIKSNFQN